MLSLINIDGNFRNIYHLFTSFKKNFLIAYKTSLLRSLQAQPLPDEAPLVGKIHPFSKIVVTFEPIQ